MKRITIPCVLVLVLTASVLAACGSKTDEIQQEPAEVGRGDVVLSVTGDGNLSLPWQRELTFGTSGKIAEINVDEGDRVTKGQVLATLDITSLEKAVKTAETDLKTAELALKTAELALKTAEFDLEVARDVFREITYPYTYYTFAFSVPEAMAAIGDAQRELKEAQEALPEFEPGREQYSLEQYWDVWQALKQAQDKLAEARAKLYRGRGEDVFGADIVPITDFWTLRAAQLEMEKAKLAVDTAQLAAEKAQVAIEKAQLALDTAKDDLENGEILAPFDGVIAAANVKEGDKLSTLDYATKTIFKLVDTSHMELKAEVDEIDIPGVKLGQKAIISIDALPDVQIEGEVLFVSPIAMKQAGVVMYEVKIGFDVPEGHMLREGMSSSAKIITGQT